jgi:Tfp pilus assembly pilus retraction ATPase PilT
MVSMDNALIQLIEENLIDAQTALSYSENPESLAKRLHL